MKYIKKNYKFLLVIISIMLLFLIEFPYYIEAPGGIDNMQDKIEIDGFKSEGSFNVAYVKEYRATIPTLIISFFNKNWDVIKEKEVLLENETIDDYIMRDKLFMEESYSNATYVAYRKANKKINILNSSSSVLYIDKKAKTNLKVGDNIIEIENNKINNKDEMINLIEKYDYGDKLNIKVQNNNKNYNKYAKVIEIDNQKKLGIILVTLNKYETKPKINIKIEENESGASAGLIAALTIYNNLIEEDITHGLKIVGTGTIDINGNVGSIGGVSYKLKSAVAKDADLFFVPNGDNYKEAIKIKKEKNYKIKIVAVSTFDEAITYLDSLTN